MTVRVRTDGAPLEGPAIYVNWHRHSVVLCALVHGPYRRLLIASPAPYLAPIRRLARLFGLRLALGTSGDGGARALEACVEALAHGESVALAVDGPRGPVFHAKRGCALLAQRSGAPIVPVAYRTRSARSLRSRWDRMLWVRFFDRVTVCYGPPIAAEGRPIEAILTDVELALFALDPTSRE